MCTHTRTCVSLQTNSGAQQKVSGTAGLTTDLGHALAWMVPRMLDAMRILHQYPYIFQLWMSCLIKLL
ncbi:TPA: hypothetical protein ACH3X2_001310 [Trebouxia sp. C0005]